MLEVTREQLLSLCAPFARLIGELGTSNPAALEAALAALPSAQLEATALAAHATGWMTPKEQGGVRFGRLSKASPELGNCSLDVVDMSGPAAGGHTHPNGEVEFCIPLSGEPRFDGRADSWIVYPPQSRHIPTVSGGRMLILYFLPGGAIVWD